MMDESEQMSDFQGEESIGRRMSGSSVGSEN